MCTASSASRTYGSSASASEYTATARTPIRRAVRITRLAISPRLATSTESSIRSAYWSSREPKGAGGDWTDERGTSEEGRSHLKRRPEASGTTERPEASGTTERPEASGTTERPEASGTTERDEGRPDLKGGPEASGKLMP